MECAIASYKYLQHDKESHKESAVPNAKEVNNADINSQSR